MSEPVKCFLIEPIYGDEIPNRVVDREWEPNQYILGWINPLTQERKEHTSDFGPGAMFHAEWLPKNFNWDDESEPHLYVILPDGHYWDIDSRASNCPRPDDRNHRCWHREGTPPNLTVTKGPSWENGAGSVLTSSWHGYLRDGWLVT